MVKLLKFLKRESSVENILKIQQFLNLMRELIFCFVPVLFSVGSSNLCSTKLSFLNF